MKKSFVLTAIVISLLLVLSLAENQVVAKNSVSGGVDPDSIGAEIYFFYSPTCAHCAKEEKFLDRLEETYPQLDIKRLIAYEPANQKILTQWLKKHNAQRYLGVVPLTFVGEDFFVGFDSDQGIGAAIEKSVEEQLKEDVREEVKREDQLVQLPLVGQINAANYSLSALSVVLGFLDGFNICSLSALVFILGLVLVLRSRGKILLFGGTFVLTTAIVYGLLIILWYKLFSYLAPYVRVLELLVGSLALLGGLVFFRQFLRYKKYGPSCDFASGEGVLSKLFARIKKVFQHPSNMAVLAGSVFAFAAAIAVVEFPCSAAVPLVFAGILSRANLPGLAYFFYIAIFVAFYMLDELIVFLVAVFKLDVWLTSAAFTIWFTLLEAIILTGLGIYYLFGLV